MTEPVPAVFDGAGAVGRCPRCKDAYPGVATAGRTVEHVSDDHHRWRPDDKRLVTVKSLWVKVDRKDLRAVLEAVVESAVGSDGALARLKAALDD